LLAFFEQSYRTVFGFETGPPLHDPLAVAFVIAPELFTWQKRRVDVELHSPLCVGRTVVDVYAHSKRAPNVNVIEKADIDGFWSLMIESLRRASNRRQER
jgi:inosine-uridine nucleoside N-ribohydrolase